MRWFRSYSFGTDAPAPRPAQIAAPQIQSSFRPSTMVRIVGTGARAPTDVGHQDHERPRARADNPDKVERGPGIRSWRHRGLAVFPARPAIGPRAPRDALGALGPWRFKHFSARRRRRSPRDLWGYLRVGRGTPILEDARATISEDHRPPPSLPRARTRGGG